VRHSLIIREFTTKTTVPGPNADSVKIVRDA
jgi:hypothetical protein